MDSGHAGHADRAGRLLTVAVATVAALAVGRLGWALLTDDLTFAYVASNSRRSAPWWYRLAGVWGAMEGSLLLSAAILALVAAAVVRRLRGGAVGAAALISAAAVLIALITAWPFERLAMPATEGFGLTPILEHWAMTIHPPMLYTGLAATLPAFVGVPPASARRWLLTALGLLTAAMALGGWWSYAEQGWGGYWAWDPVENASLTPWLVTLVAVHMPGAWPGRTRRFLAGLPFVAALGGAAVSRSGAVPSVHSFAEATRVGTALAALALGALVWLIVESRRSPWRSTPGPLDRWRPLPALLAAAAAAEVVVLTVVPLAADALGDGRDPRVGGWLFARLLAPFAAVVVGALVTLALRAGRRRVSAAAWVAHAGMIVLLAGVAGTTLGRSATATLESGSTERVAGVSVMNLGLTTGTGPRPGSRAVTAELRVAGRTLRPALVAHPDRGGILPETAMVNRPWGDVQVALVRADDDGRVLVEVRTKPLAAFVWLGAAMIAAAALTAAAQAGGSRRSGSPRRVRLRARSSSTDDGAHAAPGSPRCGALPSPGS